MFSGQFKDAMQALLDWLYKMETHLAEDQPVHGDLDTVNSLIEEHRVGWAWIGLQCHMTFAHPVHDFMFNSSTLLCF